MKNNTNKPKAESFKLHPHSIRYINAGHPWVTKDKFSANFPEKTGLIGAGKNAKQPEWILINDPQHPSVKARVWSPYSNSKIKDTTFWDYFEQRLEKSINFREAQKISDERDNYYLCFGEADQIPGLFILKLNDIILIQSYCSYWKYYEKIVFNIAQRVCQNIFPLQPLKYYFQARNKNQKVQLDHFNYKKELVKNVDGIDFQISEFGIKYHCFLGKNYDFGIYTDMSFIREKISKMVNPKSRVLNLFAYTGAYSLMAIKNKAKEVHSVDLSEKYLNILNKNIELNNFPKENHFSHVADVKSVLQKLVKESKQFDFIICDPPSASSDGKKTTSALKTYEELIPKLEKIASPNGKIAIFLNTHMVNWNKFEKTVLPICEQHNLKKIRRFNFGKDCRSLKGFYEGDYLKGILLEKS